VKLVVFDVDGTLVDSQHLIVEAQREAFAANGLRPPSRARSLSVVGLSLPEAFTALVGAHGPVEGLAAAYRDAFGRLRADPAWHEPLFPGAAELIADLAGQDGVALGIATGKSRRGDSTFDMLMARAAGVRPVGVSWGYHPVSAIEEAGAEAVARSFAELRALLGRCGVPPGSRSLAAAPISP
jgi:phosphoglycolate phosphatase